MIQKYTSASTSINKNKVPAIFKKIDWYRHGSEVKNLDYGGGKYDTATEYLRKTWSVENFIYDPYNRGKLFNDFTLKQTPYDTATLSNVLNVVLEEEARLFILNHIKTLLKPTGVLHITVYEGSRTGIATVNSKRNICQLNRPLRDYLDEVKKVFPGAYAKNGMIIAKKEA